MQPVSLEDQCYAAGLFDGEGHARVNRQDKSLKCIIRINMVDKEPLEFLQNRFGGTIKPVIKTPNKPYWIWLLSDPARGKKNNGAHLRVKFLEGIIPVMHNLTKINDCKKCLEFDKEKIRLRNNGIYMLYGNSPNGRWNRVDR